MKYSAMKRIFSTLAFFLSFYAAFAQGPNDPLQAVVNPYLFESAAFQDVYRQQYMRNKFTAVVEGLDTVWYFVDINGNAAKMVRGASGGGGGGAVYTESPLAGDGSSALNPVRIADAINEGDFLQYDSIAGNWVVGASPYINSFTSGGALGFLRISNGEDSFEIPVIDIAPVQSVLGSAEVKVTTFPSGVWGITLEPQGASVGQVLTYDGTKWAPANASTALPSLANGQIWVGNGSNVATAVTPSGDATMTNTGDITVTEASGSFGVNNWFSLINSTALSYGTSQNNIPILNSKCRIDPTANIDITGISSSGAGFSGRMILVYNVSSSFSITLINESASSTTANRFSIGSDYILYPGKSVAFIYDNSATRWRLFGYSQVNQTDTLAFSGATLSLSTQNDGVPAVTATMPTFTSGAAGSVPASGGGTTNFLRADGTFAAPPGGSGPTSGNAITVSGTAVNLGGRMTADVAITGNNFRDVSFRLLDSLSLTFDSVTFYSNLGNKVRKFLHHTGGNGGGADSLYNTFLGYDAGHRFTPDSTGYANTAIGSLAGYNLKGSNGFATSNTFIGSGAGQSVITGSFSTILGTRAGSSALATIIGMTATGHHAGLNNQGANNTFYGRSSGESNTTGLNCFMGAFSGYLNTTGTNNVYIGNSAGRSNVLGVQNVFVGQDAGFNTANTVGTGENTFVGYRAGLTNTTGQLNSFFGSLAGRFNTTGISNVFFGRNSGEGNTSGSDNTFVGLNSGLSNTTGSRNVYVGRGAASSVAITGSDNIIFGYSIVPPSDVSNVLMIGGGIYGTTQNSLASSLYGFGTTSPSQKIHVSGNLRVTGAYYDSNNDPGTSGQIFKSTATGTDWVDNTTPNGTTNADQLSYNPATSAYIAVPANRCTWTGPGSTVTPAESTTEIFASDATASTVNINYTPDSRFDSPFTTTRWIYNVGVGVATVQTNQSFSFRSMAGVDTSTFTLTAGQAAKIIWNSTAGVWYYKVM